VTDRAVFWFRRDLSLDDNLAWASATSDHDEVLPLYVLDQRLLAAAGSHRRRLLVGCVRELDLELRARGGRLTVVDGKPEHVLPQLAREHRAQTVWWNADVTAFAKKRDGAVTDALRHEGVLRETAYTTLVHSPGSIMTSAGSVPRVFSQLHKQWGAMPYAGVHNSGAADILAADGEPLPVLDGEPLFPVGLLSRV
jgi:deoxyribodipyrimidine photo-lyase